jgi:hypothetical protein
LVIGEIAAIDRDNLVTICLAANRRLPSLQVIVEVGLVVKIRYTELQAGLHVDARTRGRDTVVYLVPGLTAEQRRVALTRARSLGRLGHGPRLSAASLAMAVGVDRLKTTFSNGAAAVRGHPILLIPSVIVMSGTLFAFVSLAALAFHLPAASGAAVGNGMSRGPGGSAAAHAAGAQRVLASGRIRPPARHTDPRAQARAWRNYEHRTMLQDRIRRQDMPPSSVPGRFVPATPVSGSCLVYAVFGVCEK